MRGRTSGVCKTESERCSNVRRGKATAMGRFDLGAFELSGKESGEEKYAAESKRLNPRERKMELIRCIVDINTGIFYICDLVKSDESIG